MTMSRRPGFPARRPPTLSKVVRPSDRQLLGQWGLRITLAKWLQQIRGALICNFPKHLRELAAEDP